MEVVIDLTLWTFAAINGQDRIAAGKTIRRMTSQGESRARDPSTILTIAIIVIPIELGTYAPTAWYHCVLSAGTKAYDAYATRPDGWSKTTRRSL